MFASCEKQTPNYYTPCINPEVHYTENGLEVCVNTKENNNPLEMYSDLDLKGTEMIFGFKNIEMSQYGGFTMIFKTPVEGLVLDVEMPATYVNIDNIIMDITGYMVVTEFAKDENDNLIFNGNFEATITDPISKEVIKLTEGTFTFIDK